MAREGWLCTHTALPVRYNLCDALCILQGGTVHTPVCKIANWILYIDIANWKRTYRSAGQDLTDTALPVRYTQCIPTADLTGRAVCVSTEQCRTGSLSIGQQRWMSAGRPAYTPLPVRYIVCTVHSVCLAGMGIYSPL